jgi:hypothetical protein
MWWAILALVVVLGLLAVGLKRESQLFRLRMVDGQLRLSRGRIPPALRRDIADVLRRAEVQSAVLQAVVEDGAPKLRVEQGQVPPHVRQQLRNAISLWPLTKIRNAPR